MEGGEGVKKWSNLCFVINKQPLNSLPQVSTATGSYPPDITNLNACKISLYFTIQNSFKFYIPDECQENNCEFNGCVENGSSSVEQGEGRALQEPRADALLQPPEDGALMASYSVFVVEPGAPVGEALCLLQERRQNIYSP